MPDNYILELLVSLWDVRMIQDGDDIYLNCIDVCDKIEIDEDVLTDYFNCWCIVGEDDNTYIDLRGVYPLFLYSGIEDIS